MRVAERAAQLYLDGWAPVVLFSGSGSIHNDRIGRKQFAGSTEAEVFAEIAKDMGVSGKDIIIENKSQNTGDNYEFAIKKLSEHNIKPERVILVQKPYMERRTYATGKIWLPDLELIVTSPQLTLDEYLEGSTDPEHSINAIVGDLQRIKEYPAKGFQIEQEIPKEVWEAYEYLVAEGYNKRLIKA
ncbi:MAG: YdcF family protein [Candidatus Pacebacteria bacterium]|nr:YdcF family protein [Candidatus Paceibacterota bacterium]